MKGFSPEIKQGLISQVLPDGNELLVLRLWRPYMVMRYRYAKEQDDVVRWIILETGHLIDEKLVISIEEKQTNEIMPTINLASWTLPPTVLDLVLRVKRNICTQCQGALK